MILLRVGYSNATTAPEVPPVTPALTLEPSRPPKLSLPPPTHRSFPHTRYRPVGTTRCSNAVARPPSSTGRHNEALAYSSSNESDDSEV